MSLFYWRRNLNTALDRCGRDQTIGDGTPLFELLWLSNVDLFKFYTLLRPDSVWLANTAISHVDPIS